MAADNQIPFAVKIGGQWRFKADEVGDWIDSQKQPVTVAPRKKTDCRIFLAQALGNGGGSLPDTWRQPEETGPLALFALFILLTDSNGSLDFPRVVSLPGATVNAGAVFLLGLFGFGMKAGMMPLHFWLPTPLPPAMSPPS